MEKVAQPQTCECQATVGHVWGMANLMDWDTQAYHVPVVTQEKKEVIQDPISHGG